VIEKIADLAAISLTQGIDRKLCSSVSPKGPKCLGLPDRLYDFCMVKLFIKPILTKPLHGFWLLRNDAANILQVKECKPMFQNSWPRLVVAVLPIANLRLQVLESGNHKDLIMGSIAIDRRRFIL